MIGLTDDRICDQMVSNENGYGTGTEAAFEWRSAFRSQNRRQVKAGPWGGRDLAEFGLRIQIATDVIRLGGSAMRSVTFQGLFRASVSVLALSGGLLAAPVHAQTSSTASASQLETVVVTAERRTTDLQKTAISASVLSADDLRKKSVYTLEQLTFSTPALTFDNFGEGDEFNIRGIGKGENNVQTPSGVTTYINGAPLQGGFFQNFPFFDESSVEVLRGPQGTFSGENATGGAVYITTVKPDFEAYDGYVQAQYGNYNDIGLQGAVNMPISDDFAMRVSGFGETRNSFWSVAGTHSGDPGDLREGAARVEFLWQPTQAFQAYLYGEYDYMDQGGYPLDPATLGCVTAPTPSCTPNTSDPFKVASNTTTQGIQSGFRSVLDLKYTFRVSSRGRVRTYKSDRNRHPSL